MAKIRYDVERSYEECPCPQKFVRRNNTPAEQAGNLSTAACIIGSIVTGAAGFVIGGPVGAVLGGMLGMGLGMYPDGKGK